MLDKEFSIIMLTILYKMITWIEENITLTKNDDNEAGKRAPTPNVLRVFVLVVFLLILYIILRIQAEL
ncbi:hypothetical protein PGRAN_06491 [Listeria grandensis FSL F6-0971]|uniref:Uncharacterized protein n=1 Tax=Listeria grandensis FSL F6-0971 TaxID=1265819 RepID=W7B9J4_9LIST|nr:hypothetical protein PGRAN_06491 [Listeria grandensis FSL F6-0971]